MDAMDRICEWGMRDILRPSAAFGHVQMMPNWYLAKRATVLIDIFQHLRRRVIWVTLTNQERHLVVQHLDEYFDSVSGRLNHNSKISVITMAELYDSVKYSDTAQMLNSTTVVVCEIDMHASVDFMLGLALLCYKAIKYRTGRVLTCTHDSSIVGLDEMLETIQQRRITRERATWERFVVSFEDHATNFQGQMVDIQEYTNASFRKAVETLSNGRAVLMFTQSEDHHAALNIRMMNLGVCFQLVDASVVSFRELWTICRRPSIVRPALILINDSARIPCGIKNLGLVCASPARITTILDRTSGQIVKAFVPRSVNELGQIVTHAQLSDVPLPDVTVMLADAPNRVSDPPRRCEGDQGLGFIMELLLHMGEMPVQGLRDVLAPGFPLGKIVGRLTRGPWAFPAPGAAMDIVPGDSPEVDALEQLLPLFDFQFPLASFLAKVNEYDEPDALRVAIRTAAILHVGIEMIAPIRFTEFSKQFNIPLPSLFALVTKQFENHFSYPPECRLFTQGSVWIAIAAWHTAVATWGNFMAPGVANARAIDVVENLPVKYLSGFLNIKVGPAIQVRNLVQQLERALGVNHVTNRDPIQLDEQEIEIIHDELLEAFLHQMVGVLLRPEQGRIGFVSMATCRPNVFPAIKDEVLACNATTRSISMIASDITLYPTRAGDGINQGIKGLIPLPRDSIIRWQERLGRNILQATKYIPDEV